MTAMTARRRSAGRRTTTVLAVVAALALSACGGEDGGGQVATAGGAATATAGEPSDEASPADEQAQVLAFAACMRDNGVDMPDPEAGQEGMMNAMRDVLGTVDDATFEQAMEACQDLLPEFASGDRPQLDEETQLALADCLREQGLDVPDDLFSGEGLPEGVTRDDLRPAMEVCRDELGLTIGGAR
ncbi:MAG TPA: hypothetical protein VIP77_05680 [Jiangellaceae bacterium]